MIYTSQVFYLHIPYFSICNALVKNITPVPPAFKKHSPMRYKRQFYVVSGDHIGTPVFTWTSCDAATVGYALKVRSKRQSR